MLGSFLSEFTKCNLENLGKVIYCLFHLLSHISNIQLYHTKANNIKHPIIGFRIYLNTFEPVNGLCSPDGLYKQHQSCGSACVQPAQSAWGVPSPRQYWVKSSPALLRLIILCQYLLSRLVQRPNAKKCLS